MRGTGEEEKREKKGDKSSERLGDERLPLLMDLKYQQTDLTCFMSREKEGEKVRRVRLKNFPENGRARWPYVQRKAGVISKAHKAINLEKKVRRKRKKNTLAPSGRDVQEGRGG